MLRATRLDMSSQSSISEGFANSATLFFTFSWRDGWDVGRE